MTNLVSQIAIDETAEAEAAVIQADDIPGAAQGEWTYELYAALPDDGYRYEVIEGVLYQMPSPTFDHQAISNLIATYLTLHIQFTGLGRIVTAPLDVKLGEKTTVQPDVIVVLNANKAIITRKNITGAPDLVVEISSPGTSSYDRNKKRQAYAQAGVREYWLVKPAKQTVEILTLKEGNYVTKKVYKQQELVASDVIADFPVKAEQFFV